MTHLTDVIEEEREKIFTKYDFGYMNGSTFGVIEDLTNDLDHAMHKSALAMLDYAQNVPLHLRSDAYFDRLRTELLNNK